ncbi:MAG: hypothetical protein PVG72_12500, partial [Gammaproteobacteria bacterium]
MNHTTSMKLAVQLAAALVFAVVTFTSSASDLPGNADEPGSMPSVPVYKPPLRGAPRARVGGGTR